MARPFYTEMADKICRVTHVKQGLMQFSYAFKFWFYVLWEDKDKTVTKTRENKS